MQADLAPLLTAALALAAVLGLIWLAGRLARISGIGTRRQKAGSGSILGLEDSLALDPRRRLLLVRCADRRVLLMTGGTDLVVGWLPPEPPA